MSHFKGGNHLQQLLTLVYFLMKSVIHEKVRMRTTWYRYKQALKKSQRYIHYGSSDSSIVVTCVCRNRTNRRDAVEAIMLPLRPFVGGVVTWYRLKSLMKRQLTLI